MTEEESEILGQILKGINQSNDAITQLIANSQDRLNTIEMILWGDRKDKNSDGGIVTSVKYLEKIHSKKIQWTEVLTQGAILAVFGTIIALAASRMSGNNAANSTPENPSVHSGK